MFVTDFVPVCAGRKPRHRRAESPTPEITVKKDKYNKGIVKQNKTPFPIKAQHSTSHLTAPEMI